MTCSIAELTLAVEGPAGPVRTIAVIMQKMTTKGGMRIVVLLRRSSIA